MDSNRYPGKMMSMLGSIPIIEWVLMRVKRSQLLDEVILATTDSPQDSILLNYAQKCNVTLFRGSESNVLKRFADAAKMAQANTIVRICADNPFVDPNEIDRLVNFFSKYDCEYSCNHQDRLDSGYADGFGAEIFSSDVLSKINSLAKKKDHREHVTKYIWDNKNDFKIAVVPSPKELYFPSYKFDVDTMEDKNCLENLIANGISIDSSAKKIVALYRDLTNHKYA